MFFSKYPNNFLYRTFALLSVEIRAIPSTYHKDTWPCPRIPFSLLPATAAHLSKFPINSESLLKPSLDSPALNDLPAPKSLKTSPSPTPAIPEAVWQCMGGIFIAEPSVTSKQCPLTTVWSSCPPPHPCLPNINSYSSIFQAQGAQYLSVD